MIILDANVLLYVFSKDSPHHETYVRWFERVMDRREELGIPWLSALAFIRVASNKKIMIAAAHAQDCAKTIEDLMSHSHVAWVTGGPGHWGLFQNMLRSGQAKGDLVNDAHLAALAIEHDAFLCTNDRDFTRFPGLKIINPIAKQ